jgi:hypothetical protein
VCGRHLLGAHDGHVGLHRLWPGQLHQRCRAARPCCSTCAAGTYSRLTTGTTGCTACAWGAYSTLLGSTTNCTALRPGAYSAFSALGFGGAAASFNAQTWGLAYDAQSGSVIVAGGFTSTSITFGATTLTNAAVNYEDMFLAQVFLPTAVAGATPQATQNVASNVGWALRFGANFYQRLAGVAVFASPAGLVANVVGFSYNSMAMDSFQLTTNGYFDIVVASVLGSASGSVLWAAMYGGIGYDYGAAVANDALGNVAVAGFFGSPSVAVGSRHADQPGRRPSPPTTTPLWPSFPARGCRCWAVSFGGSTTTSAEDCTAVAFDGNSDVLVFGSTSNPAHSRWAPSRAPLRATTSPSWQAPLARSVWAVCTSDTPVADLLPVLTRGRSRALAAWRRTRRATCTPRAAFQSGRASMSVNSYV